ncbi:MAG: sialate O-acetylesterase [bacterium]|nr:sialate O-acetylesterase [bacterium]
MFPRDSNNFGHFVVEGKTKATATVRTSLVDMQSAEVIESFSQHIDSGKTFLFNHKVPAGLHEFNLEVYISDPDFTELKVEVIPHLVAGDFYIVAGQSNAVCGWSKGGREHDSLHYSPFNRALGGNFTWATEWYPDFSRTNYPIDEDCRFGLPWSYLTADLFNTYSGIWPIQLQYELLKQTGIPVCIVNGSCPGISIAENYASHTPSKPDSLRHSAGPKNNPPALPYDRVYKKLLENDAIAGVKGIFWYQGETDGTYSLDSSRNYDTRFHKLYSSWKADYPNLKKIFVMQLNAGCGGENLGLIREIQRKFPEVYKDVVVMSTVGNPLSDRSPDNCHYSVPGYAHLADKLLPLVKKHIYNFPISDEQMMPANIKKAYYSSAKQICIEFDKNIIAQQYCYYSLPDSGTAYLKDYFFAPQKRPIALVSVSAKANKLFLNLADKEPALEKITYLPDVFSKLPSLYAGPWILTESNPDLGAYSFFEFPVEQMLNTEVPEQTEEVVVAPNPSKDAFDITFKEAKWRTISVYDLYGKQVFTAETTSAKVRVDATNLCGGIYLLRMDDESSHTVTKIVLE